MQTTAGGPLEGFVLDGRYLILDQIARGGMSIVYRATDQRLDRLVAVKVMSSALSSDPAFVDRFVREARAASKLTHVNVVSVFDQGADSGNVFLVMELVQGRMLRDLLRERGALSPALAVSIMEPVLSGLAAAHRASLVHRDVKPENVLLGDDGVVKVADFGLARALDANQTTTRTGLMMGTVAYCSPEQLSQGWTDARSDVYSAGVMLFELLTGQTPFAGASPMSVAYQHVHEQIPAPSSLGVPVPEPLDQLVLRATNRHPGRRPANAGAFLAELHDVAAELGFPVLPVPARQRPAGRPLAPAVPPRAPPPLGPTKPSAAPTTQLRATRSARTTAPLTPGPHPNDTLIGRPVPLPAELPPDRSQAADPVLRYGSVARRRRRRWRRTLIALLILALLGGATGYTSWWFASGRYKHLPSVTGQQQDKAVAALNDAGFAHVTVQTAYNNAKPGTVFKTDPAAGTRLLPNRMITIVVSRGPETCPLPKVAGGTEARARAALAGCEFTTGPPLQVVTTQQSSDTVPKDAVIGTEPKAGAKVKPGQAVTLIISTGPPIITVPKVSGLSQDDATNKLQAARFKVVVQQDYSDTVPEGSVISEDPSGGSKAVKFSTVTIQVSLGPHMVTIPKIPMRTSVDDATAMLTDLGLKVTVETEFGGYLGYVVGMDPPAGTVVPVGTTVTLIAV